MLSFTGSLELPASQTGDFFRGRLDQMIDLRHPLAVLSTHMPSQEIEASLAGVIARKVKAGKKVEDIDLFGPVVKVSGGGVLNAGRPRLPMRLMVSLLYLKHTYNLSDEELVVAWSENVYYQFFSGSEYYEPKAPCDFTLISKFRKLIGEEGMEELLAKTIKVAVEIGLIKPEELKKVVVDSTVMPKAIAHPTDSKLLETSRDKLVEVAKANSILFEFVWKQPRIGSKARWVPRFRRRFPGQGINNCMTIEEVVEDYIRETVKPLTPDQARLKALQGNVDRARLALQTARVQQRQRREAERRAKASQAQAAITTSLKG